MGHRLKTEKTGMVLANHEENEFVEEAKAEANQRNDSVGISLSFQSLNDCDEMLLRLGNTLNNSKLLSLFSKKAGKEVSSRDIALIISTARIGYTVLKNGYRRHICKSVSRDSQRR